MAPNGFTNGSHGRDSPRAVSAGDKRGYYEENGRCYDSYRKGKYMFPCDRDEMNRLDIFHKLITLARSHLGHPWGLFKYELPPSPSIMDLGCGSGIWAVDMADRCGPDSDILGWDLSLHQPALIPQGLRFEQRDFEEHWIDVQLASKDLIRGQLLLGSVANWHEVYHKVLSHLKPGGVFEHIEIDYEPLFEDPTEDRPQDLINWSRELHGAMEQVGRRIRMDPNTKAVLQGLGFVNVQHEMIKIPYNQWPSDEHQKLLGRWFNLGMSQGIAALTLASFTRVNGYTPEAAADLIKAVRHDIAQREYQAYCYLHIYTAQRPTVQPH